jgi:hypothetical protein
MPPNIDSLASEDEDPNRESEPSVVGTVAGRIVYRAMREDVAGGPIVGPTARTLGVRPDVDIPVIAGFVHPNTGGMSVAPDRPENLHPLRRPRVYGGSGKDPVWWIATDQLGGDLQYRQNSPTHGLIEPVRAMALGDFQKAIENTKRAWGRLP